MRSIKLYLLEDFSCITPQNTLPCPIISLEELELDLMAPYVLDTYEKDQMKWADGYGRVLGKVIELLGSTLFIELMMEASKAAAKTQLGPSRSDFYWKRILLLILESKFFYLC